MTSSNSQRFLARWIATQREKNRTSRVSYGSRKLAPMVEVVENRQLLCNGPLSTGLGVIAGTAFVDSNHDGQLGGSDAYLANATIQLFKSGQCTSFRQTTTDKFGGYSFEGLAAGDYVLKEIAPCGYKTSSTQVLSDLNPGQSTACNTIKVTVVDPNSVYNAYKGIQDGKYAVDQIKINLGPDQTNAFGPMTIALGKTKGASDLNAGLTTFCVNDLQSVSFSGGESWKVIPSATAGITGNADTSGRIGYLYNHYGNSSLTNVSGPALQLAIWELLYDGNVTPDFWGGNFQLDAAMQTVGGADADAILAQARQFYVESAGHRESVAFLKTATPDLNGQQSMLAHGSFNFGNTTVCNHVSQCGTPSFWSCDSGQKLIHCFNGDRNSTDLGDWLACSYPNLFGPGSGGCKNPHDLTGKTNCEVAEFAKSLGSCSWFNWKPECDVLATALSQYASCAGLGGDQGSDHGFRVDEHGVCGAPVNVGNCGGSFGFGNFSNQKIGDLLNCADAQSRNGRLFDGNCNQAWKVGSLFSAINFRGSIGCSR